VIRLSKKSLIAVAAMALSIAAVAFVAWGAATTQGTRWLLTTLIPLSGVGFSVQKIEGTISDHLFLTGVRVSLAQQQVELDRFELRWKPLLLLAGTLGVQELTLSGVRIQDDALPDNKPPNLAWPRAPRMAHLLDCSVARLRVTNFSYRSLQEQPVLISTITSSVAWQDDLISITDLTVLSPTGRITGTISAGFNRPSLTADLTVSPADHIAEMDRFSLQVRRSGAGPEPFVGAITVAGSAGTRKLLELSGDIGMAHNAFNLRRLSLTRPGQKGLVTAEGSLVVTAKESVLALQIKAAGLDLAPELNVPTDLSGTVRFAGTLNRYQGDITLANQAHGWQAASVSVTFHGTGDGIKLAPLNASILDGVVEGNLDLNWRDGFSLQGVLSGKNLNPARFDPDWKGEANFSATGKLARVGKGPVTGSVTGALQESRLHGQALTGELQADFSDNNLLLTRVELQGKGFALHASGDLKQRLTLSAQISDLSRLVPGSAGTLKTDGWIRWHDGLLSGAVAGTGSTLAYGGTRIAGVDLSARLDEGAGYPLQATVSLHDVAYSRYALDAVTVSMDGTVARHAVNATLLSADAEARLTLSAGYSEAVWKGEITRFSGKDKGGMWDLDAPAAFAASAEKFSLSPLVLIAGAAEHFEVAAELALNPLNGQARALWTGVNLARANPYLADMHVTGSSSGEVRMGFLSESRLTLSGSTTGSGSFTGQGHSITLQQGTATFDGSEKGVHAAIELASADGGRLKGTFSSPAPFLLAIPEKGELALRLSGFDLSLLKPWLPSDIKVEGRVSGRANGILLPGQRFELDGTAALSGGAVHQSRVDGALNLTVPEATASWGWRGETLSGALSLSMADYGQVRAHFQLPVAAHFPVAANPGGTLQGSLVGQLHEKGIISALVPGIVQGSFGELDADLSIGGTWAEPQIGGKVRLDKAGAYLPTAGIHLTDVTLSAHLEKNLIHVDSYRALSGSGHIEGAALLTLEGWRLKSYRGTVRGKNFQAVYLPELRILSSPELSFEGTPEKLSLRGDLHLPELHVIGSQSRTAIAPSSDVIMIGTVVPREKSSPLVFDVQVQVLLGERVFVKVAGIDAQLGGAVNLSFTSFDRITSKGELKVIKGRYRTYGVNLEIVRGRLFFAGGPINVPSIDVLALRTIGDIRAGVTVAGTLQKPVTKLYSEPAMPDVDVLAYIVLGHPLGSNGQQASLVAQAAGALLSTGQAEALQNQIKNQLGLSTLEIQEGVGGTNSSMGYKPLQVTPPGALPAAQQPGITNTVLTVGKYVTPSLYISYGRSLYTGSNLFLLRYDIFKKWQLETQTGTESGIDLFYKLEFK
jgi:translocation and assembly module TamB